mmetsp:Transcript_764/g.816  ORF Transcript_764/g.816 Transcript_764/m.816 type:complete len:119 (+) Transcript_764:298-654(+)
MSFVELFSDLEKYIDDPKRRFKFAMRVKRGLTDTSQPGGFYKDKVYLKGAVDILKNRKSLNFDELHCGKLSALDLLKIQEGEKKIKIVKEKVKLPLFLTDLPKYLKQIDEIAQTNFIS